MKVYTWGKWPTHLMTQEQLVAAGYPLSKGLPPPAAIAYGEPGGRAWLYDAKVTLKLPGPLGRDPRQPTPAAAHPGWRCPRCAEPVGSFVCDDGLCRRCHDHLEMVEWARDLLNGDFVVLDSETTGLYDSEFVQLGVVSGAGEILLNTYLMPEHPEELLTSGASAVNHITPDMLVGAPRFPDIYPRLQAALAGKKVVIYNVKFDWPILQNTCWRYALPVPACEPVCAMEAYSQYVGRWSNRSQSYRWQKLPSGDHSALGDCLATLRLLQQMAGIYTRS